MSGRPMHVVIAGGGTGGHLYPGIALARELQDREPGIQVLFVGTARGIEAKVIPHEGFPLKLIRAEGLLGKGWLKGARVLLALPMGISDSMKILNRERPDLVVGVGGYASGPLMLAAILKRIPRMILEQNAIPGMTNRLLSPWVDRVVAAYEESRQYFKNARVDVLGNPIRKDLLSRGPGVVPGEKARTLLVFGGSRGARSINRAMVDALDHLQELRDRLFVIHQTGEADLPWVREAYALKGVPSRVEPFLYDMGEAYSRSTLIVCRSGAMTVSEVTACGLPAILIPYPHATHDHQKQNARVMQEKGAAVLIEDRDLTGPGLAGEIKSLLGAPDRLREMAEASRALGYPEATRRIADLCVSMIQAGQGHVS